MSLGPERIVGWLEHVMLRVKVCSERVVSADSDPTLRSFDERFHLLAGGSHDFQLVLVRLLCRSFSWVLRLPQAPSFEDRLAPELLGARIQLPLRVAPLHLTGHVVSGCGGGRLVDELPPGPVHI